MQGGLREAFQNQMTDRSIESELKNVQKKLDDIEKKQEMMKKLYDLERDQQEKMGKRPSNHVHEMGQKYIIYIDEPIIGCYNNKKFKVFYVSKHTRYTWNWSILH